MTIFDTDPAIHTDPTTFDPSRFVSNPSLPIYTYGVGSRSCTGTALANRLLYMFFVRVLSAFEILPFDDVDVDAVRGCADARSLVSSPKRYRVVFRARELWGEKLGEELRN